MIEYAVRYTGKPAIAESRIIDYDGKYVTFWYQRHEDNKLVKERVHIYEFFKHLIIHIPDENFKTVRYYGIYSKKHKFHNKMIMLIKSQTHKLRNQLNSWRMLIIKDFDIGHLIYPKCKVEFEVPLEMVLEFEQEDAFDGLPISLHHIQSFLNVNTINVFH